MIFFAFGVNHLRAPVELREAFALDEQGKRSLHRRVRLGSASELLLLSTCNRTEAYLYGSIEDVDQVRNTLADAAGISWPEAESFFFQDEAAVRHVLEVAAGLKSLVLGDAQIFSQLKEAYRIAVEEQRVDTTMHRLLHTAFRTAKRVINETALGSGAASIPYQAAKAASVFFGDDADHSPKDLSALIVGSGSMGRLATEALRNLGILDIAVTNRSEPRGREAADRFEATYVSWNARHGAAAKRDIVIVATSATDPVIHAAELTDLQIARKLLIIDISVPRNVEPAVADIDGVHVINVDQLVCVDETASDVQRKAVPEARRIVDELHGEFVSWVFHHQALQPAIEAIADTLEAIRVQEVSRHHQRFSEVERKELDRLTRSIIQKILAVPIVRLKSVDPESIDFVHGVRLLHALFERQECDDDESGAAKHERVHGEPIESPREDCPIDPQLSGDEHQAGDIVSSLDDVLRLFSGRDVDPPS